MKKILFLILALSLLSLAMFVNDGGGDECTPTYPGGAGDWLFSPADEFPASCWYLHTNDEFDLPVSGCIACHDGVQAHEW